MRRFIFSNALFLLVVVVWCGCSTEPSAQQARVGRQPDGAVVLPVSQTLQPAGTQVVLPGLRPQAVALSPDSRLLVTSGKTNEIVVLDPASGEIKQRVLLPPEGATAPSPGAPSPHNLEPDKEAQLGFTGLLFSPDGSRLYLSNVQGSIKVFNVEASGRIVGSHSLALPAADAPRRKADIPSGLEVSADGRTLWVALNLSNRLGEIDLGTGKTTRTFDVGVAPYDVVLVGQKAFVSNWGGRRPDAQSLTGPAGKGTLVRVDPVRHTASEGSVSIVDLVSGRNIDEVMVGLHASALAVSPGGKHVVVANAGSDTLSVLDGGTHRVVETVSMRWQIGDLLGASPNALTFDPAGEKLYVCNGTQNAVAVVSFQPGVCRLLGLIPVGWFPGAIVFDRSRDAICVANIKGIGSGKSLQAGDPVKFNSHQHQGSLSLVPLGNAAALAADTRAVLTNYRRTAMEAALLPARPQAPPRPVPERVGEPSVFKHVIYIIKENRTYDQVFGGFGAGRGDPSLCIFGEEITPNQHRLAREFVLLDNAYCSGILSADGHQWASAAFVTAYLEKSFAGFPRSYPDGMDDDDVDALSYSPAGFLWDNAVAHHKTFRNYGEFAISDSGWADATRQGAPTFMDYYRDFVDGTGLTRVASRPAVESLRPYLVNDTVGWNMDVPDVLRAARFLRDLKLWEAAGEMPQLVMICLPNNHTSGTKPGMPTPAAHVADNDLALGRIVEAVSRSRFWRDTCILVIEDDPQDGWDHVSPYRTTAFVASAWTKRGEVVSTQYNQPGLIRTIELILGLPPMNQFDATATPFFDCFTDQPDFRPFVAVPNRVPLDQLNPSAAAIADPLLREHALASNELPLDEIDKCPEDLFNRILWHAMKGSQAPYPVWATRGEEGEEEEDEG